MNTRESRAMVGGQSAGAGPSSWRRFSWPLAIASGVFLLATGCATTRQPTVDPASAGEVLRSCSGADESFCRGFIEATASSVFAHAEACPPPITFEEVRALVLPALAAAQPDEGAVIPATDAIRAAWPCSSKTETESNNAAPPHLTAAAAAWSLR